MKKIIFTLLITALFAFIFLYSTNIYSRAGGGHSYSDSSSRSHSSSSSSSRSSYRSSKTHIHSTGKGSTVNPVAGLIGLFFIGGTILIIILISRKVPAANKYNETIKRANDMTETIKTQDREINIKKIKELDPAFSEEKFIERVKKAFLIIQQGWSEQNLSLMRSFVSNGIYARFSVQIDMQRYMGFRNQLENIKIINSWVDTAYSDNLYDVINAGFAAQMDDKNIDLKTGKILQTNTSEPFTEFWTFMRRKGAKTTGKAGLIESRCPNCGSAIKITESGNCEYCKAYIMGGQYDWVLTEITQECEYSGQTSRNIQGIGEMINKDPDFNASVIEDKTSVMFFNIASSLLFGDGHHIRNICRPDYFEQIRSSRQFKGVFDTQSEWYTSLDDVAIGAVELKRIILNQPDGFDRVEVVVKWSGANCERNSRTKEVRNKGENHTNIQTYTLARRTSIKSSAYYNFKTVPCHNCGAPISNSTHYQCEFCGSAINDGTRDWVLINISPL